MDTRHVLLAIGWVKSPAIGVFLLQTDIKAEYPYFLC